MNPPAYMSDMIEAQDRINDFSEQAHQSIERSLSSTIADPQVLNPKSVNQIGRRAAQIIAARLADPPQEIEATVTLTPKIAYGDTLKRR